MIIGREAHIYWPEDKAWYKAYIDTFHVDSHGHRVLYYEDCNWEFVDLPNPRYFSLIIERVMIMSCKKTRYQI